MPPGGILLTVIPSDGTLFTRGRKRGTFGLRKNFPVSFWGEVLEQESHPPLPGMGTEWPERACGSAHRPGTWRVLAYGRSSVFIESVQV